MAAFCNCLCQGLCAVLFGDRHLMSILLNEAIASSAIFVFHLPFPFMIVSNLIQKLYFFIRILNLSVVISC